MAQRSGRRPGLSGTRDAILDAARERFSAVGFDKASIRSIATQAGVDSALVHHYFGTKQELFVAVVRLPVDPSVVVGPIAAAPLDELGETVVRTVVGIWDSPAGAGITAAFRGVMAGGDETLLRTFLLEIALKGVRERVDDPRGSAEKRVALAASQMLGVFAARKILRIEPLASMPIDEVVAAIGPTIHGYLTGTIT
ncbi:TetR/AcrR family transcriptional regulator [Antrihabitans cavernicola]|uniref:TetR/AcrR family transcriptional regulator n=1 Tax=Antrihabitans cavernicola TaxID=2495913 RepID=A0A5A7S6J5_9NOCA|nr:TetR family transcriptional regulator [Spelaeibacter cavernicola]KAA0021114.1 TetR/AcrR family transcriptional regulator [Spelaeibacter cavernicola]